MRPITITGISKDIRIRFDGQKVILPSDIQQKVDAYWNDLLTRGKKLRRGEVFTVTDKNETADYFEVIVSETDYAHYLYSQNVGGLEEYTVHIIHSAALVESVDNKIIFGAMNERTSRPGIIQCCGGGIDRKDINDSYFDLDGNTVNELAEELGIDTRNKKIVSDFRPALLKEGGPTEKITVVYTLKLGATAADFLKEYSAFEKILREKGEEPEFGKIIVLEKEKTVLENFVEKNKEKLDEYMPALLLSLN